MLNNSSEFARFINFAAVFVLCCFVKVVESVLIGIQEEIPVCSLTLITGSSTNGHELLTHKEREKLQCSL